MASQWFYQAMGQRIGPVSLRTYGISPQRGTIAADTLVRKGQDGSWVPAQRVQGLFSTANITPPSARSSWLQPNEQPSAPPPINSRLPTPAIPHEKQVPVRGPEGNDFTKWLRLNIRQTLIAWPIIATLIALTRGSCDIRARRCQRMGTGRANAWRVGCLPFSLFHSASWLFGCTFFRL